MRYCIESAIQYRCDKNREQPIKIAPLQVRKMKRKSIDFEIIEFQFDISYQTKSAHIMKTTRMRRLPSFSNHFTK